MTSGDAPHKLTDYTQDLVAPLWRVDVSGVSHRFVEVETKEEAVAEVEQSLIRAMNVHAPPAHCRLAAIYEALGPIQRRNVLAKRAMG